MSQNLPERPERPALPVLPVLAVGAICVHDGRLLVVQRRRAPGEGLWSVPGGRVEAGEQMADAVRRELAEETGIEGTVGPLCGLVERIGADHHYVICDYWVEVDRDQAVAGDDAAAVAWVTRSELARLPCVTGLQSFLTEHGVLDRLR
jgi:8-oxo-dGTP diphosphatase